MSQREVPRCSTISCSGQQRRPAAAPQQQPGGRDHPWPSAAPSLRSSSSIEQRSSSRSCSGPASARRRLGSLLPSCFPPRSACPRRWPCSPREQPLFSVRARAVGVTRRGALLPGARAGRGAPWNAFAERAAAHERRAFWQLQQRELVAWLSCLCRRGARKPGGAAAAHERRSGAAAPGDQRRAARHDEHRRQGKLSAHGTLRAHTFLQLALMVGCAGPRCACSSPAARGGC